MWQVEQLGTVSVVRSTPAPTVDIRVPEQIWGQLDAVIAQHPTGSWVIDVSSERLLTSEALALIVGMVRRVQGDGGRIAFAHCSEGVTSVLVSMRLSKMLPMYGSVDEGVTALSAPVAIGSSARLPLP
jgi:anti-anti-sigma factor